MLYRVKVYWYESKQDYYTNPDDYYRFATYFGNFPSENKVEQFIEEKFIRPTKDTFYVRYEIKGFRDCT